jgi:PiT family inorganic phosphate transporter
MIYFLIAAALVFDFLNGFHDSSNIVATVISSKAMRPRPALYMTAAAEFVAPFLFGVAVANTVGKGLIAPQAITIEVVIAAVLAAVLWNLLTWLLGIPSSSSHALVGGLLGAAILSAGLGVIQVSGLLKVLLLLIAAVSLLAGYLSMLVRLTFQMPPAHRSLFKRSQV